MTISEAVAVLTSDNTDLVLIRVSGSVSIHVLDQELQGKLGHVEAKELLTQISEVISAWL